MLVNALTNNRLRNVVCTREFGSRGGHVEEKQIHEIFWDHNNAFVAFAS